MKDVMGMMKQAQQLQARMQQVQADLDACEVEGRAGGGLVRLTFDGKGQIKGIVIDKSLMNPDETEVLEDLILAASQDGRAKVAEIVQAKMKEATGGMALPPGLANLF
jgi:nucleoid-associated protein EbfC